MSFNVRSSSILLNTLRCGPQPQKVYFPSVLSFKSPISSVSTALHRCQSVSFVFAPSHNGHVSKRRRLSSSCRATASLDIGHIEEPGSGRGSIFGGENSEESGSGMSSATETRGEVVRLQGELGRMSLQDKSESQHQVSPNAGDQNSGGKRRIGLRDSAEPRKQKSEPWKTQKDALKKKFGEAGWNPRKKLSPDTMEGIRALHEQDPERYSTPLLAEHFKVSPEAIRRILKSKWRPSEKEMEKKRERWAKRHDRIWDQQAELGLRPQRRKERAQEDPDEFEEKLRAKEMLDNARSA
ncbi:required for respiratory growth protein 9, mitochondrial [Exophiala spinifera]|uniref:Required for respiratory growth protein 9, mitochondrial n=1 Tax=Exophiala spinifera TaxID=91928 RepID=A0A0D2BBK4_9EURO|nr:required for respiratory growth protein 9, mitochondrial [Exophiala spinifera]KIW16393.1 required for respiratory growth protein 9, mitochondrial [Exophiala spinifera]